MFSILNFKDIYFSIYKSNYYFLRNKIYFKMNTRPQRKARNKARQRLGITTTNGMEIEKKKEEHKESDEHHSSTEDEDDDE